MKFTLFFWVENAIVSSFIVTMSTNWSQREGEKSKLKERGEKLAPGMIEPGSYSNTSFQFKREVRSLETHGYGRSQQGSWPSRWDQETDHTGVLKLEAGPEAKKKIMTAKTGHPPQGSLKSKGLSSLAKMPLTHSLLEKEPLLGHWGRTEWDVLERL